MVGLKDYKNTDIAKAFDDTLIGKAEGNPNRDKTTGQYTSGSGHAGFSGIRRWNAQEMKQRIKADKLTPDRVKEIISSLDKQASEAKGKKDTHLWAVLDNQANNHRNMLQYMEKQKGTEDAKQLSKVSSAATKAIEGLTHNVGEYGSKYGYATWRAKHTGIEDNGSTIEVKFKLKAEGTTSHGLEDMATKVHKVLPKQIGDYTKTNHGFESADRSNMNVQYFNRKKYDAGK